MFIPPFVLKYNNCPLRSSRFRGVNRRRSDRGSSRARLRGLAVRAPSPTSRVAGGRAGPGARRKNRLALATNLDRGFISTVHTTFLAKSTVKVAATAIFWPPPLAYGAVAIQTPFLRRLPWCHPPRRLQLHHHLTLLSLLRRLRLLRLRLLRHLLGQLCIPRREGRRDHARRRPTRRRRGEARETERLGD